MFAWKALELVGVSRGVIEHHLAVCPNARPIKQKARRQALEKQAFIVQEVHNLQEAEVVQEVRHPEWLANPVVVPKKGGKERMCVDFTSLNKACPQDPSRFHTSTKSWTPLQNGTCYASWMPSRAIIKSKC